MDGVKIIELPTYKDGRGSLTTVEREPFEIKRAFWLYDLRDMRGGHAHKECYQLIIAVHGLVTVKVDGKEVLLMDPGIGLHVSPGHFVELSGAGTALVLCSDYYDEDDYIE
jgi:dTDP-4-dehydrorhamnose 3,5-epimerase-like enzyme